jgi:hypothetical protein
MLLWAQRSRELLQVTGVAFEVGGRAGIAIPDFALTSRVGFRTSVIRNRRETRLVFQLSLSVW